MKNINRQKYEAFPIIIGKKGEWQISPAELKKKADVGFIAMHGTYGEDGSVQAILDKIKLPYTGSPTLPSSLAMNKYLTTELLKGAGIAVPPTLLVSKTEWVRNPFKIFEQIKVYINYPMVVKPNDNGSSVGVSIVKTKGELISAIENVFTLSRGALIQTLIKGVEVTCGVFDHGWPESAYPLMPTEIVPKVSSFFDYRAKYEVGGSLEITPARLSQPVSDLIRRAAVQVHKAVGASGFSRTDFILAGNHELFTLEINTIPGLTEQSLLPKAALVSGISFSDLIDRVIIAAVHKYTPREMCGNIMSKFFGVSV